jgi:hypothetical protein
MPRSRRNGGGGNYVSYDLEGAEAVKAAVAKLSELDQLDAIRQARKSAAEIVAGAARGSTPNTTGRGTGNLASAHLTLGTLYAGVVAVRRDQAPYVGVIHFGWDRNRPRARGGPVKANPWLSDAASATESSWTDALITGLQEAIEALGFDTETE